MERVLCRFHIQAAALRPHRPREPHIPREQHTLKVKTDEEKMGKKERETLVSQSHLHIAVTDKKNLLLFLRFWILKKKKLNFTIWRKFQFRIKISKYEKKPENLT